MALLEEVATGVEDPSSASPSASEMDAIVLAVKSPAQVPTVGWACLSISANSSSVTLPLRYAPIDS
jgi:hypothetical protein